MEEKPRFGGAFLRLKVCRKGDLPEDLGIAGRAALPGTCRGNVFSDGSIAGYSAGGEPQKSRFLRYAAE
jgi:hypothetical protein